MRREGKRPEGGLCWEEEEQEDEEDEDEDEEEDEEDEKEEVEEEEEDEEEDWNANLWLEWAKFCKFKIFNLIFHSIASQRRLFCTCPAMEMKETKIGENLTFNMGQGKESLKEE